MSLRPGPVRETFERAASVEVKPDVYFLIIGDPFFSIEDGVHRLLRKIRRASDLYAFDGVQKFIFDLSID